jgi:hypothetical protein
MNEDNEFLKDLLLSLDPAKLKAFVKTLKAEPLSEPKAQGGPCKTYTTVIKKYKCIACNSEFQKTYQLSKGETINTVDPDGKVHVITSSGREGEVSLSCTCSCCHLCILQAAKWNRVELEKRWIALVQATTFKEKRIYYTYVNSSSYENMRMPDPIKRVKLEEEDET